MKLASFRFAGRDRIGFALDEHHVADLAEIAGLVGREAPSDMIALIEQGEDGRALLRDAGQFAREHRAQIRPIAVADIHWHPPVRRPAKICGIALNNSASDARKISSPNHPLFFLKPASCLVGHRESIEVHDFYGSVHRSRSSP